MYLDNPDIIKTEKLGYVSEPEISFYCCICGEAVFLGEEYFHALNGLKICRFCIRKATAV